VHDPTRWFHPTENFCPREGTFGRARTWTPGEQPRTAIVTYREDASPAGRDALQRWAATGIGVVVTPATSRSSRPLEAYTADWRLGCDGVELDQLTSFTDRHFSRPIAYIPHGTAPINRATGLGLGPGGRWRCASGSASEGSRNSSTGDTRQTARPAPTVASARIASDSQIERQTSAMDEARPLETAERRRLPRHGKGGVRERRSRALLARRRRASCRRWRRRSVVQMDRKLPESGTNPTAHRYSTR
jgi:hypothetical protein